MQMNFQWDIFEAIDEETSGPKIFKGTIRIKIEDVIKLEIVDFEFVNSNLEKISEDIVKQIRTD